MNIQVITCKGNSNCISGQKNRSSNPCVISYREVKVIVPRNILWTRGSMWTKILIDKNEFKLSFHFPLLDKHLMKSQDGFSLLNDARSLSRYLYNRSKCWNTAELRYVEVVGTQKKYFDIGMVRLNQMGIMGSQNVWQSISLKKKCLPSSIFFYHLNLFRSLENIK